MINYNDHFENTENQFASAIKELKLGGLLRQSNITKSCGISAYEVFRFLLMLVFRGKNLFRFLDSKRSGQAFSKNTYYRFLNECTFNWKKFLLLLSAKATAAFSRLTRPERVRCFVLDDSVVPRGRSKKVELLARIYDHVSHTFKKGFTLLALGWTDGYSFIPCCFHLLSSALKRNRYQEIDGAVDRRTNGYKARQESLMKKPDAVTLMLERALQFGIRADYVLMDTWFTTEPMIASIMSMGLDAIGMVKELKQRYWYHGKRYQLSELKKFIQYRNAPSQMGSVLVRTKGGIPVKIVFVRNRNKKSECLYLLSTDCSLSDSEIVRIYGNRWSIEVFFKASKSLLKLGSEFQSRSYDAMVSHTTIVFTRYILLEWIRRNKNDEKTYGELFFMLCEDIQDMDFASALTSLMALLVENMNGFAAGITTMVKCQLQQWFSSQPLFIQALFEDLSWES